MKTIDTNNWDREKTIEWFRSFSDSTYSMNVRMDVTDLVERTKSTMYEN